MKYYEYNVIRSKFDELLMDGRLYSDVYDIDYMYEVLNNQTEVPEYELQRIKARVKEDYDFAFNTCLFGDILKVEEKMMKMFEIEGLVIK